MATTTATITTTTGTIITITVMTITPMITMPMMLMIITSMITTAMITTVTIMAIRTATITTTTATTGMITEVPRRRRIALTAGLLGIVLAFPAAAGPDPTRDVLWVALKTCVLAKKLANRTFPCLAVDLGAGERPGTAVMRAPGEPTHVVVMPTDTVTGLESTPLRGSRGAAYWTAALAARRYVTDSLQDRIPEADVALAVNSARGRSQDQLHIHVDCLRPKVLDALNAHGRQVRRQWAPFPVPLAGDRFQAMRIRAAEADTFNPFAALTSLPGRRDLHRTSFAAVATRPDDPEPGYILLAYRAPGASAEDVMDHGCAIAGAGRAKAAG